MEKVITPEFYRGIYPCVERYGIECIIAKGSNNPTGEGDDLLFPYGLIRLKECCGLPKERDMKYVKFLNGDDHYYGMVRYIDGKRVDKFNMEWTNEPPIDENVKRLYDEAWKGLNW